MPKRVVACLVVFAAVSPAALADGGQPKVEIVPAAQQRAERINLRLADVGSYWSAAKGSKSNSTCFQTRFGGLTINGRATSPDLVQGDVTFTASRSVVFETGANARLAYARLAGSVLGCMVAAAKKNPAFTFVRAGRLEFPALAERSSAYEVKVIVKEPKKLTVLIDVVLLERERALAVVLFTNGLSTFDTVLMERLARLVAQRMKPA